MTDVVLITGVPGAGKSTVATTLAQQMPKCAYISADRLRTCIKGGFKNPAEPWDDETRKQYYLSFKNAASLTENFLNAGFKVVIDDVVHAGDLFEEWQKCFNEFNFQKVVLLPPKEFSIKRNKERDSHFVKEEVISRLYDDFIQHNYSDWIVIDNSTQTVDQTVSEIKTKINW